MKSGRVYLLLLAACACSVWAQTDETEAVKKPESREDTHILGIVPDYDTVRNSAGVIMPISTRTKFWLATEDVFDPFSFLITGFYAGGSQLTNQYHEFGQGAAGYAKRYAGAFADNAVGNYFTEAAFLKESGELKQSLFDPDFEPLITAKAPRGGLDILQASARC